MKKIFLSILFITLFNVATSANNLDIEQLENLLERISIETGSSTELDEIERFIEKPINLTNTTISELLQIPGFTSSEAKSILAFLQSGEVHSNLQIVRELNLSDDQFLLLELCTTLESPTKGMYETKPKSLFWRVRNKNYLNKVAGVKDNLFEGSELDLYQRISAYYDDFSFGLLTDKDIGEVSLNDFSSFYLSAELFNTQFILGDYYLETGMGNILWKSFAVRKGAEVISPAVQKGRGFRSYRSSLDYNFFRGFAIKKDYIFSKNTKFSLTAWYSSRSKSGTYDSTLNVVTSLYTQGYYRTSSEIQKKNVVNENSYGANFDYVFDELTIGATSLLLDYQKEIQSDSKRAFAGMSGLLSSIYSFWEDETRTLGIELSRDARGNFALKAGSQFDFNSFELAFNARSFSKNFRAPYGYNFGEYSAPANEYGLYSGIEWKSINNVRISAYLDIYNTYGETYSVPEPTSGIDILIQTDITINSKTKLRIRLHQENKKDAIEKENKEIIFLKNKTRFRLEIEKKINRRIKLRLRTETNYVSYENNLPNEFGIMAYADIKWKLIDYMTIGGRMSYYSTQSYESAIWQFEMAMPGYMTTQALYGNGSRAYVYTHIDIEYIDIWLRYSTITKNNVRDLGSGKLMINGNNDNRLMIQLDFKI